MVSRMWIRFIIVLLLCIFESLQIDVTEQYIEDFKRGFDEFQKNEKTDHDSMKNFNPNDYNETDAEIHAEHYDFIIIGAGASGAVLANRLSEVPEWKILLLEAGGPENRFSQVPGYFQRFAKTSFDWNFKTVPQKNWCLAFEDHRCEISSGKALGGSTAINGMLITRGNSYDYDKWADQGNKGWCYEDVLPYFKKAEDANLKVFDRKFHHAGGPVHIENPQFSGIVREHLFEAAQELGMRSDIDYNGANQLGMGTVQMNSKKGVRHSTAKAYLDPIEHRKNLIVKTFSYVIQILIGQHTKEATGVKYLHNGKMFMAKSDREIILSAGALNTPKLLQLSGVGPKDLLKNLHIRQIADLNVGQNMKEHIGFFDIVYRMNHTNEYNLDPVSDYLRNGHGPLTNSASNTLAYIETSPEKTQGHPDAELLFGDTITAPGISQTIGFAGIMLAHPKSIGSVMVASGDPLQDPHIDPNQLTDPDNSDLITMLKGVHYVFKLLNTTSFRHLGVELVEGKTAGCENYNFATDEYWKCAIRHTSFCLRHFVGTARMGPKTDKNAVVDNMLRVYGVKNLRVADNSVIPVTITGHTMAVAIMIGEKASDIIKEHWDSK